MGLFDSIRRPKSRPASEEPAAPQRADEGRVPEVTADELMLEQRDGRPPTLLDCREDYEWQRVRISGSIHIPMGQVPRRLAELDHHADLVVVCAHGNRSYRLAGFLIEKGFCARSLRGGLADWQARGGRVENGHHP